MCAARTPCRYLQKVDALPDPLVERRLAGSIADPGYPQESEVDVSAALKRLDRSFQTDARAKPAHPEDGAASGASAAARKSP